MSEYKLKTGEIGKAVVEGYKKVEGTFVDTFLDEGEDGDGLQLKSGKVGQSVMKGYKVVEDSVVGGYKKVEDAFVNTFLEKVDDSTTVPKTNPQKNFENGGAESK